MCAVPLLLWDVLWCREGRLQQLRHRCRRSVKATWMGSYCGHTCFNKHVGGKVYGNSAVHDIKGLVFFGHSPLHSHTLFLHILFLFNVSVVWFVSLCLGRFLTARQTCVSRCPPGSFPNRTSRLCEDCLPGCTVCQDAKRCQRCRSGRTQLYLQDGVCVLECHRCGQLYCESNWNKYLHYKILRDQQ